MEYLEYMEERGASVTAEYVKAEVLAKVSYTMSEKDPSLRVTKVVADYYSLHRKQRLDSINTQLYRAVLWRTQGSMSSLARSRCCRSPSF
jgi:hypothetical protein